MNPQFNSDSDLIPAIIQDDRTGQVLMLAYMNQQAYEITLETGRVTFFSRSRQELWTKGETSGNTLQVRSVRIDCDGDTILVKAIPAGPVCHTGSHTCFGEEADAGFLHKLEWIINSRAGENPEDSYTAALLAKGINKIAQKVGEEAVETVIAALNEGKNEFIGECADLHYHLLVLLHAKGLSLTDIEQTLRQRHGVGK